MTPPDAGDIAAKIELAEKVLGHAFADRTLLLHALTHPSAISDHEQARFYERLEFLGDSLIGMLVAEEVFGRFPKMPEGGMTRVKISVVNGVVMSKVACELGLAEALVLGDSEIGTGRRGLASALENAFEALTAALYLDAGLDATRAWVLRTLGPLITAEAADVPENPKSLLQEIVQAQGGVPAYHVTGQSGPPHDRRFTSAVEVGGEVLGEGCGRTKKEAEAAAASAALERLRR